MKNVLKVSIAVSLIAGQAAALSCMQPDAARTFQQVAAAEERYVVLLGEFDFVAPPQQPVSNDAQSQQAVAQFTGQGLGISGFGAVAPLSVTLTTSCAGPWCGGFPRPNTQVLAFVEQTSTGYELTLGACGGSVFSPATAPVVASCMRGEVCEDGVALR